MESIARATCACAAYRALCHGDVIYVIRKKMSVCVLHNQSKHGVTGDKKTRSADVIPQTRSDFDGKWLRQ